MGLENVSLLNAGIGGGVTPDQIEEEVAPKS